MNKNKQKKIVSWLGLLLIAVALVFIVNRFLGVDLDFAILASPWVITGLIAIIFAVSFVVIITALNYRAWLYNVSGEALPYPEIINIYCSANLYKYIPGGFLYVVGRNKVAIDYEEVSHGKVAVSTVLEGVFFVIAAFTVALAFSFDYALIELRQLHFSPTVLAIIAVVALVIGLVVYFTRHRIKEFFKTIRETGRLKPLAYMKRMLAALALATTLGTAILLLLMLMGQPMTIPIALTVIGLYNVSWLTGFFVPIAPAGLGVREAATLMLLGGIVQDGYLLLAVMAHRVVSIAGDLLAYCISLLLVRIKKKKSMSCSA